MGGEGPIPISEIMAYCQIVSLDDPDDRLDFMRAIRAMDEAYLSFRAEERERKKDGSDESGEKSR